MAAPYSSPPEWSPAAWWNSCGAANDESQLAPATVVDRVGAPPPSGTDAADAPPARRRASAPPASSPNPGYTLWSRLRDTAGFSF